MLLNYKYLNFLFPFLKFFLTSNKNNKFIKVILQLSKAWILTNLYVDFLLFSIFSLKNKSVWQIWLGCLGVCIQYNVKTAEPIGPKLFVWSCVTPTKVRVWSNFKNLPPSKLDFWEFWKSAKFFVFVYTENPHVIY